MIPRSEFFVGFFLTWLDSKLELAQIRTGSRCSQNVRVTVVDPVDDLGDGEPGEGPPPGPPGRLLRRHRPAAARSAVQHRGSPFPARGRRRLGLGWRPFKLIAQKAGMHLAWQGRGAEASRSSSLYVRLFGGTSHFFFAFRKRRFSHHRLMSSSSRHSRIGNEGPSSS